MTEALERTFGETTISRWVRLQRITWSSDHGSKASRIAIEKGNEQVHAFDVNTSDLGTILQDALALQADELPQGAHAFRLVSYDEKGLQLSELNQTVRGRNKDASAAGNEAITQARAAAMNVSNAAAATLVLRTELEREQARNNDLVENQALLIDKLNEMHSSNFEAQLRLLEFNRRMDRSDKFYEAMSGLLVPLGHLVIEKFGPQLLKMQPAEIFEKAKAVMSAANTEGEPNATGPTQERTNEPSPRVPEPGQEVLSRSPERGPTRDSGNPPRKRGAKAPKQPTRKGKRP